MIRDTTPGGKHRPKKAAPSPGLDGGRFKATLSRKQRVQAFLRHWWWAFVLPPVVIFLLLVATIWYVYANTSIPEGYRMAVERAPSIG